jgi:AbrB family looped-hinge helix DNA binding protein
MEAWGTTKMSSKGQVVIPQKVRNLLGLKSGTEFVVYGEGDVVILKAIPRPTEGEIDAMVKKAKPRSRTSALDVQDIVAALARGWGKKYR